MGRQIDKSLRNNKDGHMSRAETFHRNQANARDVTLLTHKEIAEVLGITRARCWQIEQRAIRKIREALIGDPAVREWLDERGILPRVEAA